MSATRSLLGIVGHFAKFNLSLVVIVNLAQCVIADDDVPSNADRTPILRLEAGGPTSPVRSLAFHPNGKFLYAGGWDKVVRVWSWDAALGKFTVAPSQTYRVPIGPGDGGIINAIAVSPDGNWLAVAGKSLVRGVSDLRQPGWVVPTAGAMTPEMRLDEGAIYLYDTRTRAVRSLRGHTSPVIALSFAPQQTGKPLTLISAGQEWDAAKQKRAGAVRVWTLAAEGDRQIASVLLPDPATLRSLPGIAAWHTGAAPNQLQVAISWGDEVESLRIFDVQNQNLNLGKDGQYNHTVAWWADGRRVITGATGILTLWKVEPGKKPVVDRDLRLPNLMIPRAISLFASTPGGKLDRAALVVKADTNFSLRVVDLDNLRLLDTPSLPLWDYIPVQPLLAVEPGTGRLAVAGNRQHEVATLSVSDLVANRAELARLRGAGRDAHSVAFVTQGDVVGLLASPRLPAAPGTPIRSLEAGDLIFDPTQPRVIADLRDWTIARPEAGEWRADVTPDVDAGRSVVNVHQGGRLAQRLALPVQSKVSDLAVCPPCPPLNRPLLALATHRGDQPLLEIYDLSTGSVLRQLSGHTAPISSVAFSPDGQLLISAANDRTLCLWKLADLPRLVGLRGALPGIAFESQPPHLLVARIDESSPYRTGPLTVGDKILGLVAGNKLNPIESLATFYLELSRLQPGSKITLQRQSSQRPAAPVEVTLGQGTDERKPLLTMFLNPGQQEGDWEWIGWSPLGPYESSGDEVEQLLGWHFNTGVAAAPTRFALIGEYQSLRRPGLTQHLLKNLELPNDADKALHRPQTSIWLEQAGQVAAPEISENRLARFDQQAVMHVEVRDWTAEQIGRVTWRAPDGSSHAMLPVGQNVWTADLADVPLSRSELPLEIVIESRAAVPQSFSEIRQLVYVPGRPTIELTNPLPAVVSQAALALQAKVRPAAAADGKVKLRVRHMVGTEVLVDKELPEASSIALDELIELRPGDNTITLQATNAQAPKPSEAHEQSVLVCRVVLDKELAVPPAWNVQVTSPAGDSAAVLSDQGKVLVVDSPRLRLTGSLQTARPLTRVGWSLGDQPEQPARGFEPGGKKQFEFDQPLELTPGTQRLVCRAQAEGGAPAEISLLIDYRPQLPEVIFTAPPADSVLCAGRDAPQVPLVARLGAVAEEHPYSADILVNGAKVSTVPVVDSAHGELTAQVPLSHGENRIQVRLANAWGREATSTVLAVRYTEPPQIVEVSAPPQAESPLVEVNFLVKTRATLPITALRVNSQEVPITSATEERREHGQIFYRVIAQNIPLVEGPNKLQPAAANQDGWSVDDRPALVASIQPVAPKAEVEFITPRVDGTTVAAQIPVKFTVRSPSRLLRVVLLRDNQSVADIDVAQQVEVATAAGTQYQVTAATSIALEARDNQLRIEAVNAGGQSDAELTMTYVRKPVEILVDRLETSATPAVVLAPELKSQAGLAFPQPAPEGCMWLVGRVRWPDLDSQRLHQVSSVQVSVNGLLQPAVPLKAAMEGSLEWSWRTRIRLNRSVGNRIRIGLPGVARSVDSQLEFQVDCREPDLRQRLHLLVVGIGEENRKELETLALRTVQGRRVAGPTGEEIEAPAFSKGWIYLLNNQFLAHRHVIAQLNRIRLAVGKPNSDEAGMDVVMVYYKGQEAADAQGRFYLLTDQSKVDPRMESSAISSRALSECFASSPGAQLFLLDVERKQLGMPTSAVASTDRWPRDPHMASLRYAWQDNQNQSVPADAQLLTAVSAAVPRATRLKEIEQEVSEDARRMRQKYGASLTYEQQVPEPLSDLVLANAPMTGN